MLECCICASASGYMWKLYLQGQIGHDKGKKKKYIALNIYIQNNEYQKIYNLAFQRYAWRFFN